jgi:C-methyltransferase
VSDADNPRRQLASLLRGYQITQLLYVFAVLGAADRLAAGPLSPADLAASVAADPDMFQRLLPPLRVLGVIDRGDDGRYRLTVLGDLLRTDVPGSLRPAAVAFGQPWWWQPWGHLLDAVRTGGTAFDGVFGEPLYAFLGHDPEAAAVFNATMTTLSGVDVTPLAEALRLDGAIRVVDVGGGHGVLGLAIRRLFPRTEVVVFDRPDVVADLAWDDELITAIGGDFFVDAPPVADVYVLKDVLHNWTDEQCRTILGTIRAVAPADARLHILERVLDPEQSDLATSLIDITMVVLAGGRERSVDQYAALLASAGWQMVERIRTASNHSIVSARLSES